MHPQLTDWFTGRAGYDARAPLFPALAGKKTGSAGGLSNAFNSLMERASVHPTLGEAKQGKGRQFRSL